MELVKVEIISNHEITGNQNALQYINRDATAMFTGYNDNLDGAIYLMRESTFKYVAIELDTYKLDYVVISKHTIKG